MVKRPGPIPTSNLCPLCISYRVTSSVLYRQGGVLQATARRGLLRGERAPYGDGQGDTTGHEVHVVCQVTLVTADTTVHDIVLTCQVKPITVATTSHGVQVVCT